MANILKEIARPFEQTWDAIEKVPGQLNREMSRGLKKMGVGGKLADDPLESIGAAVGTVLGGWMAAPYVAGALGGSAAAGGAAAGAGGISQGLAAGASGALGEGLMYGAGDALLSSSAGSLGGITASSALPSAASSAGWMSTLGDWASTGKQWLDTGADVMNTLQTYDQMFGGGGAQGPSAPAFRPSFQQQQSQGVADQIFKQEMSKGTGGLVLDPYGNNKARYKLEE